VSPNFELSKVKIVSVGPCESSPVQLGPNSVFNLEGRCSIQLSYGGNTISNANCRRAINFNSMI